MLLRCARLRLRVPNSKLKYLIFEKRTESPAAQILCSVHTRYCNYLKYLQQATVHTRMFSYTSLSATYAYNKICKIIEEKHSNYLQHTIIGKCSSLQILSRVHSAPTGRGGNLFFLYLEGLDAAVRSCKGDRVIYNLFVHIIMYYDRG